MATLPYDVTVSRDGSVWLLEIAPIGGTAEARWLGESEDRAREFVADFEGVDPQDVDIHLDVVYPGDTVAHLAEAQRLRDVAAQAVEDEWEALRAAARELDDAGVTKRDIGDILGLAVPRVRKILRGGPREQ